MILMSGTIFEKPIDITNDSFILLTIENKKMLRKVLNGLNNGGIENSKLFYVLDSDNAEPLEPLLIDNPFKIDFNSKRNLNSLYKFLKRSYFEEADETLNKVNAEIVNVVSEISMDFGHQLEFDEEIKIDDLFKLLELRFADKDEEIIEKIIRFAEIEHDLLGINLIYTYGLTQILENDELQKLIKELSYKHLIVLDFENVSCDLFVEQIRKIIITNDLSVL